MTYYEGVAKIEELTNRAFRVLDALPTNGTEIHAETPAEKLGINAGKVRRSLNHLRKMELARVRWDDKHCCNYWMRVA